MAAGSTYTPIATTTLGSAAASYTFSSIPSTYTDLVLILSAKSSSGVVNHKIQFNGDTTNKYSDTRLFGDGSSASSDRRNQSQDGGSALLGEIGTAAFSADIWHIMNYANSTTYKTYIGRNNEQEGNVNAIVGLWSSTSAINSLTIKTSSANLATGTTLTLYGIAAA
jgi:hypothetical protein